MYSQSNHLEIESLKCFQVFVENGTALTVFLILTNGSYLKSDVLVFKAE